MTLLAALAALEGYTHHKHPCDSLTSFNIDPKHLACQCGRNAALDAVRAALRVRFEAPGPDPEPVKETR